MPTGLLCLSRVAAVTSCIWNHFRGSPTGAGFRVWQKMWEFETGEKDEVGERELPLFENEPS